VDNDSSDTVDVRVMLIALKAAVVLEDNNSNSLMVDDVDENFVDMDIGHRYYSARLDASSIDSMVDSTDEQVIEVEPVVDVRKAEVVVLVVPIVDWVVAFLVTNAVAAAAAVVVVDDDDDDVIDNALMVAVAEVVVLVDSCCCCCCCCCPYVHCYHRSYLNDVVGIV